MRAVTPILLLCAPLAARALLVYDVTPAPGGGVRVEERFDRVKTRVSMPELGQPHDALRRWVQESASAVAGYFGRLPVPRVRITLQPVGSGRINGGVTHGGGARGARIHVRVGSELTESDLREDWVLTHELVHTAVPRLPDDATWLDEGIATYVEPIARVRRGTLGPEKMWGWLAWGLPQGLPAKGDRGLDNTHTWGRTYWGGALFCFLADVEIRERTENKRSLRDALLGVLNADGDVNSFWELPAFLRAADAGTGTTVLTDLHARLGSAPGDVDLEKIWSRLGVRVEDHRLRTDDAAPLTAIRRTIPAGETGASARTDGR